MGTKTVVAPSSYINALSRALRAGVLAMLEAYFDDSGTHQGSRAVAVAAYVSTAKRWRVFEQEWREALNVYGIEFFRMSLFASRKRQFKDWPGSKCGPRFQKLVSIINHHVLFSVGTVVPMNVYEAATGVVSRPYLMAARECIAGATVYARKAGLSDEIAFIFESGAEGNGQVLAAYNELISQEMKEKHSLGPLSFNDKKQCVPLQAADILAFELYKEIPRYLGIDQHPSRTRELQLLQKVPHAWRFARDIEATTHGET